MVDEPKAPGAVPSQDIETWGDYAFDLNREILLIAGDYVPTTIKEFGLARLLLRNVGRPVSRDEIMREVWSSGPGPASRTLDAHISQLRRRLNLNPKHGFLLTAVYGFGYRLEQLSTWDRKPPRGGYN